MEIYLVRHGVSKFNTSKTLTYEEFKSWLEHYDQYGVIPKQQPPEDLRRRVVNSNLVITSELKRSIESAHLLTINKEIITTPLLNEISINVPESGVPFLKLSPHAWFALMSGMEAFKKEAKLLTEINTRAKNASLFLDEKAKNNKNIVVIGHGLFNIFIDQELQKLGWRQLKRPSGENWSYSLYYK